MSVTNSLNINATGVVSFNSTTGVFTESALTQHDVLIGGASNAIVSISPSTSGFVLTSNGPTLDPSFQAAVTGGVTLTGDLGTAITGSSLNIITNSALVNAGSSIEFSGDGVSTLTLNVTDTNSNTIIGRLAGNSTISGTGNVSLGDNTLVNLSTATSSVAVGSTALFSTTTFSNNVAIGFAALHDLTGAGGVTAVGSECLTLSTADTGSTCVGFQGFRNLDGGNSNTGLGSNVGGGLLTGSANCLIGFNAGSVYTTSESGNILFNSNGVVGESHVLRIGAATGSTGRDLSTAFIYGINGNTVANTQMVTINSVTSQLGAQAVPAAALTWVNVTTATQLIAVNTGYVTDNTTTVTYTLPASPAFGSIFEITGGVSGATTTPWTIAQPALQQINFGSSSTTVGTGGSVSSTLQFDSVKLVCIVAGGSAVWNVLSSVGNLLVV